MKFLKVFFIAVLAVAFLSSCAGTRKCDWYKGALTGAAIGAGGGYIIGSDSDEEAEGAILGALIGGVAGALLCRGEAVVSDMDGDGVPDNIDKCPNTPQGVVVDANGCPKDSDGDGVLDYMDVCPNTPQGATVDKKGCPLDSDGDGVPDYRDQCPETPAGLKVDETGCAVVAEVKKLLVLEGVKFKTGSSEIVQQSKQLLDNTALKALNENPNLKVRIEGHTDSVGSEAYNMNLSFQRAEAVMKYLVAQGVDSYRMKVLGKGEDYPVATNDTAEGRAHNRRIEFIILSQ
ncbi:MAG: OmpA family protein [Deltaproteobacteria bacterium]|nr:OmpA family protein [Deltaproteobacteria bacterium]